jgi:tetratricopeptide (TPR) repeat protein
VNIAQNRSKNNFSENTQHVLETGNKLIKEKKYSEALLIFEKGLEQVNVPQDVLLSQIGIIHFNQGKVEKAEHFFKKALFQDSSFVEANFNLGVLYQHIGEYGKALPYYKRAIQSSGHDADIYERMADCCYSLNNKTDAIAFFDAAFKLKPDSINTASKLSEIYLDTGDLKSALNVLQIAMVSHPDVPEFFIAAGSIYKQMGELERALAHFRKVVVLDGSSALGFYQLGEICFELGMLKQAFPFYAKSYKLHPLPCLLQQMGRIYEKQNKQLPAIQMYEKWIESEKEVISSKEEKSKIEFNRIINYLVKYYSSSGNKLNEFKVSKYLNIQKPAQEKNTALKEIELTSLQLD